MLKKALFGIEKNETVTPVRIVFIILLTVYSIGVNFLGTFVSEEIKFPLFLDSLFSIGVTSLCGLVPGIICALATNLFVSLHTHVTFLFSICHFCTVLSAWLIFHFYDGREPSKIKIYPVDCFIWAGFFAAITNALIGNIISDYIYINSAKVERSSVNVVVQGIYFILPNLKVANNLAGIVENLVDKYFSAILSFVLYKNLYKPMKTY